MIRVLQVCNSLNGGGVERLLHDYCSILAKDFHFDFLINDPQEGIFEKELSDLGCKIYRCPRISNGYFSYMKYIKPIIKNGSYDIIHNHNGFAAYPSLRIAKKCGIKVRIAHSHICNARESFKDKLERLIWGTLLNGVCTSFFACGRDAGIWMWGKRKFENGKIFIMKNGIHTDNFLFDKTSREAIRGEFNIEDDFVIGNIGRFSYQKNHDFLLDIFNEILKIRPSSKLFLVGGGELENEIKDKVIRLNLKDKVIFAGVRNDANKIYNAFDVFVLPSRFEGLAVVLVEAQANGLRCFTTTNTTSEAGDVAHLIEYIPSQTSAKEWANMIVNTDLSRKHIRGNEFSYDINESAKELKTKYLHLLEGNTNE